MRLVSKSNSVLPNLFSRSRPSILVVPVPDRIENVCSTNWESPPKTTSLVLSHSLVYQITRIFCYYHLTHQVSCKVPMSSTEGHAPESNIAENVLPFNFTGCITDNSELPLLAKNTDFPLRIALLRQSFSSCLFCPQEGHYFSGENFKMWLPPQIKHFSLWALFFPD